MGVGPVFEMVEGDFALVFDIAVLIPQWGQYPGVYLLNTLIPDANGPYGYHDIMHAVYAWSDATPRRFRLWS